MILFSFYWTRIARGEIQSHRRDCWRSTEVCSKFIFLWNCDRAPLILLTWFNAWTSRRANATFTANPTNPNELILFGGEFYDGQRGAWLQIWDRLLDWYYMDLNRLAPITKIFLVFLHIQYICTMTFTGTLSSYYLNYLCTYFHHISLNVTFF